MLKRSPDILGWDFGSILAEKAASFPLADREIEGLAMIAADILASGSEATLVAAVPVAARVDWAERSPVERSNLELEHPSTGQVLAAEDIGPRSSVLFDHTLGADRAGSPLEAAARPVVHLVAALLAAETVAVVALHKAGFERGQRL